MLVADHGDLVGMGFGKHFPGNCELKVLTHLIGLTLASSGPVHAALSAVPLSQAKYIGLASLDCD